MDGSGAYTIKYFTAVIYSKDTHQALEPLLGNTVKNRVTYCGTNQNTVEKFL
jgi:hypothetical protein